MKDIKEEQKIDFSVDSLVDNINRSSFKITDCKKKAKAVQTAAEIVESKKVGFLSGKKKGNRIFAITFCKTSRFFGEVNECGRTNVKTY